MIAPDRRQDGFAWESEEPVEQALEILTTLTAALRRNLHILLLWVALWMGVALAIVALAPPDYIAVVQLVLGPLHQVEDGPEVARFYHQFAINDQQMQTQVRLVMSDSLLHYAFDTIQWPAPVAPADRETAFAAFESRVSARRLTLSYAIEIAYRAADPRLAARTANSIAAAYARDRVTTAVAQAGLTSPYMRHRSETILAEAMSAAADVRNGRVPDVDLVDADLRILGPAVVPVAPAFPRPLPLLSFAAGFGIVTGLIAIAVRGMGDGTIRSAAQLWARFGVDCLTVDDNPLAGAEHDVTASLRDGIRCATVPTRVALLGRHNARRPWSIGIFAWSGAADARRVGEGLVAMLAACNRAATLVDVDDREVTDDPSAFAALNAAAPSGSCTVATLPPLETSPVGRAMVSQLDVTLLVAEVGRTPMADVAAARQVLQIMGTTLTAVILVRPARSLRA